MSKENDLELLTKSVKNASNLVTLAGDDIQPELAEKLIRENVLNRVLIVTQDKCTFVLGKTGGEVDAILDEKDIGWIAGSLMKIADTKKVTYMSFYFVTESVESQMTQTSSYVDGITGENLKESIGAAMEEAVEKAG